MHDRDSSRIYACYQLSVSVVNRSANQQELPRHLVALVWAKESGAEDTSRGDLQSYPVF